MPLDGYPSLSGDELLSRHYSTAKLFNRKL
jgi:hypothetical protein